MAGKLGDILIQRGLLTEEQLASALASKSPGQMLGDRLLDLGLLTADQLGEALSIQFDVPYCDIEPQAVNVQVSRLLPEAFQRSRQVVPVNVQERTLTLAMVSPDDIEAIAEAELLTGYQVESVISHPSSVVKMLDHAFDERSMARQTIIDVKLDKLRRGEDDAEVDLQIEPIDAPVVRLVQAILLGASNAEASDIHLEPDNPEMRVRYRVDGELQQVMTIPSHIEEAVIARIKVMANMNTTEQRRPQDGQISLAHENHRYSFRVSSIPTTGGEKVVLRLLDEGGKSFHLEQVGFSSSELELVQSLIDKPHGMLVLTGPTGSGKSSTLYAVLTHLNHVKRNIVTVEDPVEHQISGVNQVQSNNEYGMGFANALRFILRQDPDIIMVGEIRDHETANTAIQAALTGHLLLSTLHTNDAVSAVTRLIDLGIDPFKVGGALLGSIAQRLLRSICRQCKTPTTPSKSLLDRIGAQTSVPENATFYAGKGCRHCQGTGYSGRIPIFEIFPVTHDIGQAIEDGIPAARLREMAIENGMTELLQAGLRQALLGKTTLEEVYFKTIG